MSTQLEKKKKRSLHMQPLFNQVADAFRAILICVFADNTVFLGPTSQTLAAADFFNNLLAAQNLQLNATIYYIQTQGLHSQSQT
jgi:hypothetical protein